LIPIWARLVVLFVALGLFAVQVGAYVLANRPADPVLGPLSVALVGATGGLVIAGVTGKKGPE
jgi:hypothetical protein